jgi:2-polyprenyl-3-methyl-5-hydroxy-6-metoxy-1,4-benzoquinol methylase
MKNNSNTKKIEKLESLHFNQMRNEPDLEYERIVPLIIPDKDLKILDIGCGEGLVANLIKKNTNEVTGMDVVDKYQKFLKYRKINFVKHDAEEFPYPFPSEEFDVIILLSVLEHLYRPDKCLEEVRRILKKDGIVIICVPNYASAMFTWSNLLGKSFHPVGDEYFFYSHIKYFTYSSMLELLKLRSFFPNTVICPLPKVTRRYKQYSKTKKFFARIAVNILNRISPRWCQAPIIIAGKQKTKFKKKIM